MLLCNMAMYLCNYVIPLILFLGGGGGMAYPSRFKGRNTGLKLDGKNIIRVCMCFFMVIQF